MLLNSCFVRKNILFNNLTTKPYPLPLEARQHHHSTSTGAVAKRTLYSPPATSGSCRYGYSWANDSPFHTSWVASKCQILTLTAIVSERTDMLEGMVYCAVYYRECSGPCKCRLSFDGQADPVLNVNNKISIAYDVLFSHLHGMLEGCNPLATLHRSMQDTIETLDTRNAISYPMLQSGWVDLFVFWTLSTMFICPECGTDPWCVVCDGTAQVQGGLSEGSVSSSWQSAQRHFTC